MALKRGFGIQYWGESFTTRALKAAPHGLLIVEPTRVGVAEGTRGHEVLFDPKEIAEIRSGGHKRLIGYLNLTEIEPYREYWRDHVARAAAPEGLLRAQWIGPITAHGERLSQYWSPVWEAILIKRIERLMSLGLDGIFFDDVLHYFSFVSGDGLDWSATGGGPSADRAHAAAMAGLVTRLAACVRKTRLDAMVIVNNGVFLAGDVAAELGPEVSAPVIRDYLSAIDGILVESAFAPGAAAPVREALTDTYLRRGINVLTVDFADQFPDFAPGSARWSIEAQAVSHGFSPYVAEDHAFDRLHPPSGTWAFTARSP